MDVMAALINRQYVEHKAWFRCPAPSRVDAGIRSAAAGPLEVSVARYRGFEYYGQSAGVTPRALQYAWHGAAP
jgi:hypothetical protein